MCTHTDFEPLDFSGVYKELSKLDGKYPLSACLLSEKA